MWDRCKNRFTSNFVTVEKVKLFHVEQQQFSGNKLSQIIFIIPGSRKLFKAETGLGPAH